MQARWGWARRWWRWVRDGRRRRARIGRAGQALVEFALVLGLLLTLTLGAIQTGITLYVAWVVVPGADRKSTRLNSSHANISYAVFCLKKKKKHRNTSLRQITNSILCYSKRQ